MRDTHTSIYQRFLRFKHRTRHFRLGVALLCVTSLNLAILSSCQEASMECLSRAECDDLTTCVAGQCLSAELKESATESAFQLYVKEMHPRLVTDCGVCHAAAAESVAPSTPEGGDDAMHSIDSDDPFGVPTYSAAQGDSGWRIYIDDPTPAQLLDSYRDTVQYLNPQSPSESLLFAFGRGEMNVSLNLAHPKLYPNDEELEAPAEAIEGADYVGYQRLINWAQLDHAPEGRLISYDLDAFNELFKSSVALCGGCHGGDPIRTAESPGAQGGFAFVAAPTSPEELYPLTALINFDDPSNSSLIRVLYGEFDHINLSRPDNPNQAESFEKYGTAAVEWIESLRP